jgi:hypothetical protein
MTELIKLLEYGFANKSEQKKLLDKPSFKSQFSKEKLLMISEVSDYAELLESTIASTVIDGAKERQCMRNILPIIPVGDSYQAKVDYGTTPTQYAGNVAEGANISIETENYSSKSITLHKVATRPLITKEMIEDCRFGMVELELKKAGARLENRLNQEAIGILLDEHGGTPSDRDPTGSHVSASDIGYCLGSILDTGWHPSDLILHPVATSYLYESGFPNINFGVDKLWGLNTHVLDATVDASATYSWSNTDTAGNYCGIMLDASNYAVIAMREDVHIKKYDDYIQDLVGVTASMRYGCGVLNDNAAIRILGK